jgi:sortase A
MRARRIRRILGYLLIAGGALFLYLGGRDFVESRLGQHEAQRNFEQQTAPKPSPFHSSPDAIARLEIPRLGADLYVVEGDGARQLRLGPGHIAGTALPGQYGNCIIAGHRDTHFRVLKDIRAGDEIVLETRQGEYRYRVETTQVVSQRDLRPLRPTRDAELHLVTCYPFYYIGSAPKRFIVRANLEAPVMAEQASPGRHPSSPKMN